MVSTAKYFLPRLLAGFLREHPGVEIDLAEGNKQALVELLRRQRGRSGRDGHAAAGARHALRSLSPPIPSAWSPYLIIPMQHFPTCRPRCWPASALSCVNRARAPATQWTAISRASTSSHPLRWRCAATKRSSRRSWQASGLAFLSPCTRRRWRCRRAACTCSTFQGCRSYVAGSRPPPRQAALAADGGAALLRPRAGRVDARPAVSAPARQALAGFA